VKPDAESIGSIFCACSIGVGGGGFNEPHPGSAAESTLEKAAVKSNAAIVRGRRKDIGSLNGEHRRGTGGRYCEWRGLDRQVKNEEAADGTAST
jgi:hypothetical protein